MTFRCAFFAVSTLVQLKVGWTTWFSKGIGYQDKNNKIITMQWKKLSSK
jgi:hypothetical protein